MPGMISRMKPIPTTKPTRIEIHSTLPNFLKPY